MPITDRAPATPGVCWIDLGAPDPEVLVGFYGEVLGWRTAAADASGYRLAFLDRRPVAAFGPAEDPGPPYWTVYAHTGDAVAATEAASVAGAAVLAPPSAAGSAGVAAVVRAPSGLHLALWQPGTHAGTVTARRHGGLASVELRTRDRDGDSRFLRAVLGWATHPDGAVGPRGRPLCTWSPVVADASSWLVRFAVDDVAAAVRQATAVGAHPSDDPPGTLVDPAGAVFGLVPVGDATGDGG